MNTNLEAFQALLARMREEFLAELPERCNRLDDLTLILENSPDERNAFDELFRGVHSLKGSGGTHGLSIITTICHQLENLLTETDAKHGFGSAFATISLAYIDLLRRAEESARQPNPNFAAIESALDTLRQSGLQSRKSGLIAESSPMMAAMYQQLLAEFPVQLTLVENGLSALERLLHEHYDFVIVGRELKELNGIAMIVALRSSQVRNQLIPAVLVSSKLDSVPDYAGFKATILRDKNMADNLLAAVQGVLKN